MDQVTIVVPVFNDWESLQHLIRDIEQTAAAIEQPVGLIVVNDGSHINPPPFSTADLCYVKSIACVHLVANQGHQRAIAIGLVVAAEQGQTDAVIVMDADGEDRPQDIPHLLEAHRQHPDHIVVAWRAKRSEGLLFRVFYTGYKALFWMLTGESINFGNFSLIPGTQLQKLVYMPSLWNHLAATIRRSNIPLIREHTVRGERYAGESTMNFTALVLHGLSAISVYLDIVAVRVLFASILIVTLTVSGIITVVIVRYFTTLAIPGWATNTIGLLVIIMLQTILFSAGAVFAILNARSQRLLLPAVDGPDFIRTVENWHP